MCKPGKSFNTGVKTSYFRHMKVPCKTQPCRRGSAPYRRSDWTSRLWAMSKLGQFKTTRALSLTLLNMAWTSLVTLLCSWTRNCALQRAQGWPGGRPAGLSLWNQPSEEGQSHNIEEPASNSLQYSFPRDVTQQRRSQQSFPEQRVETVTKNQGSTSNSRGKTKPKHPACYTNRKQVTN